MAAKIKDGLFIGDAETSQSEVFINDNKISNLINLSGREVHNVWASHGLVYLTYYWEDRPEYKLFSSHEDALLTDIVEFIDVSISHGISVLLFSRNGTGRCVVAACLYLMMKYRWGFEKTYDYVYSKKPDIDLNKGFIQQMFALDMKLLAARQKAQAAKYGVDNGFKIEANMTISDISAMLPPIEAKRWNGWDPNYVIETAELAAQQMDGESKGENGRYGGKDSKAGDHKRSDPRRNSPGSGSNGSLVRTSHGGTVLSGPGTGEDDELILIYSFLNSKNTITVLPGPYLDVYEIPKNFKLKFNPVCYEEDVNWFPSAKTVAERVVLKGSRAKLAALAAAAHAQPKASAVGQHGKAEERDRDSKRFSDAKALDAPPAPVGSANATYTAGAKSVVALENIAPMHVIRSQREAAAAEHNGNSGGAHGGHGHHSGSSAEQREAAAAAQMYYSHPSVSSSSGQAPGEAYYNPDHSPPASAHSSPVHGHANSHHSSQQQHDRDASRNGGSSSSSAQGQSPQNYSNDLYEFVGISTDQGSRGKTSREAPPRTWGPRDSMAIQRDQSISSIQSASSNHPNNNTSGAPHRGSGHDHKESSSSFEQAERTRQQQQHQHLVGASPSVSRGLAASSSSSQQPLTAEDRLRNLMADMQRHKTGGGGSAAPGPSSDRNAGTGPSLYELATMQIPNSSGTGARQQTTAAPARRDAYELELEAMDRDQDEESDPLSAFQRIQDQPYGTSAASGSASGRGGASSGGAVRARHDVITHGSTRPGSAGASSRYGAGSTAPSGPRTAWGGSSTGSAGAGPAGGSKGVSPSSSRPASPQPGATSSGSGTYNNVPSRYASPSASKRASGPGGAPEQRGSISSNLSVNSVNSSGSNQVVGAGANSGSRVYRFVNSPYAHNHLLFYSNFPKFNHVQAWQPSS